MIDGRPWFRFMDRLYSPLPVHDLDPSMVAELCELRLEFMDELIDETIYAKVAHQLREAAAERIAAADAGPVVLDFGTGDGRFSRTLATRLPNAHVLGCDISFASLRRSRPKGRVFQISTDGDIPIGNSRMDLTVACFVLHFTLPVRAFEELHRITRGGGHLVVNTYGPGGVRSRESVERTGWKVVGERDVPDIAGHRILAFQKRPG
ncbi:MULTISPECIES: class I SAM-dependent methyltransferase [Micromonospora]|uniref:Methyltransferase domain-containing protein n=1 Tax=Micromonospora yangpuensis TaxID=683228 RepID=A0A1C6U0H4_9ACTN|nr:class I SAM-dependent methyltransferase [Micromonospora yangpuensis]GGM11709.1 hypothetical protein GCM10012279_32300 [Micromonospora yangpuensis]SCL47544.1 Methyltransferase domain-containing protein [Micromonospora yangpuensis]